MFLQLLAELHLSCVFVFGIRLNFILSFVTAEAIVIPIQPDRVGTKWVLSTAIRDA